MYFNEKRLKSDISTPIAWVSVKCSYLVRFPSNKEVFVGATARFKGFLVCFCTVKPAGVVLVGPHGSMFAQRAENGRVRSHKIDVDSGVQLAICENRARKMFNRD